MPDGVNDGDGDGIGDASGEGGGLPSLSIRTQEGPRFGLTRQRTADGTMPAQRKILDISLGYVAQIMTCA